MVVLLALCSAPALASSLDLIEVGGAWGTPAATNPTALWWNPAGLSIRGGTEVMLEVAPTFGRVTAVRDAPDYGLVDPSLFEIDPGDPVAPADYDYSGTDTLSYVGAVPFLGISSDLMVPGLGVGLALAVPSGKGGKLADFDGANRYALREGNIQTIHTMIGASYRLQELISLGVSGSLVNSRYYADTDTTIYPDLAEGVADILVLDEQPASYQDGYAEHPGYTVGSVFALSDVTATFGAGVYVTPLGDLLGVSLAYNHGVRLDNTGDLTLDFRCPPAFDPQSRAAAETIGACDIVAEGEGSIGYRLPSRLHLGAVLQPVDRVRLELMGAYVFWSVFDDYEVVTKVSNEPFLEKASNALAAQEAALLASQERLWARDHRNTFWVGLDGKVKVADPLTVGARITYDQGAVEAQSISANNYDADMVVLGGLVDVTPARPVSFSLSFSHQFLAERVVTDSPFAVSVDPVVEERYRYPSANGTYTGSISRIGLSVRARLLAPKDL